MRDIYLIIASILILGLLTSCGVDDELWAITNDTQNDTTSTDDPAASSAETQEPKDATPPLVTEQAEVQQTLPPPPAIDISSFRLSLDKLVIYQQPFGKDELYELRMIMSATQKARLSKATLAFMPDCRKENEMLITLNGRGVYNEVPRCGKEIIVTMEAALFQEGQNVIAFQQHAKEIYPLTGIVLLFTYTDGMTEPLPAADFTFKPAQDVNQEEFRTLDGMFFSNSVTRTFSLKADQLYDDLELKITASAREGSLIILLNGYPVYEDDLPNKDVSVTLPKKYLLEGMNNIEFIGLAD